MGVGQAADSEQPVRRHGPQAGSQLLQVLAPVNHEAAGPPVAPRLRQRSQAGTVGGAYGLGVFTVELVRLRAYGCSSTTW